MNKQDEMIKIQGITKSFGSLQVLKGIDLTIGRGEIVSIVGPSGAGKTTLIKKLLKEAYAGEKLVLIENEFGEIGIDGGFMQDAGIEVTEMNSGCICCSLVGDFGKALQQVITETGEAAEHGLGEVNAAALFDFLQHHVLLNLLHYILLYDYLIHYILN